MWTLDNDNVQLLDFERSVSCVQSLGLGCRLGEEERKSVAQ
jgi:hypothetical protein